MSKQEEFFVWYNPISWISTYPLYFFLFSVLFVIPHAVLLSVLIGLGGYGCPKLVSVLCIMIAIYTFRWMPPILASAVDAHTTLWIFKVYACIYLTKLVG